MSELLKEYLLGDMRIRYVTDEEKKQVGLVLLPKDLPYPASVNKQMKIDSLVQIKVTGDVYDEAYALGNSLRNGETVRRLAFEGQREEEKGGRRIITTWLRDERGYWVAHVLTWKYGTPYVRIFCRFENQGEEAAELEMFESFSLSELSPYLEGDGYEQLKVCRLRSVWSQEGRLEALPLEDLQLEPAWDPHAVRCERYGQAGSMPVNKFFPFVAVKDKKNKVFWGAQLAHPASWQMELYRKDDGLAVSGGLADRDFGHWMKRVEPGEVFTTPEAVVSVCHTDSIDIFTARLTASGQESARELPRSEQELPIIFNEYCTTWGCPSHENIRRILDVIRDKGFTYFVIDCGWYKKAEVPWDISMGDYEVSRELFPQGLSATVEAIREAGMIPGIWFEIETVGRAAKAYQETDHLLKRDGRVLTTYFRRFWDMTDPWVLDYLENRVIKTLNQYGFGYMKVDYNETIGIGCDGAESLGEGLRRNMEAAAAFLEKVKSQVPGIVLENCASGGHRLEPGMMARTSMASFSDAHECVEIPIIAANLHRCILPRQSQIWAVIRTKDSLKRIVYSVANTFLGRMCISGDVTELSPEQWTVLEEGMDFYRKIAPIIKEGQSYRYGPAIRSLRHPEGWQALVRVGTNGEAYLLIHTFGGRLPDQIRIELPEGCPRRMKASYSWGEEKLEFTGGTVQYHPTENFQAAAFWLVES